MCLELGTDALELPHDSTLDGVGKVGVAISELLGLITDLVKDLLPSSLSKELVTLVEAERERCHIVSARRLKFGTSDSRDFDGVGKSVSRLGGYTLDFSKSLVISRDVRSVFTERSQGAYSVVV